MNTIQNGLTAVNAHQYKKAYALLSKPLQNQVSFGDFHDVIRRVKSVHLTSSKIVRETPRLVEVKLAGEGLEEDREDRTWRNQKAAMIVVFVPENGIWKVIQVDFHDRSGKKVNRRVTPNMRW